MEKILGRCYKSSSKMGKKSRTWRQAQVECQNLPGNYDLATVDSKELNDALMVYKDHWIGLHDMFHEGQHKWANEKDVFEGYGTTFKQKPWRRDQPDVSYNDILINRNSNNISLDAILHIQYFSSFHQNFGCGEGEDCVSYDLRETWGNDRKKGVFWKDGKCGMIRKYICGPAGNTHSSMTF